MSLLSHLNLNLRRQHHHHQYDKQDPFEMIDDVPPVQSEVEDLAVQVSQIEVPTIHTDGTISMTPPLTPPVLHSDGPEVFDEGNKRLLSKLGGYGWRG